MGDEKLIYERALRREKAARKAAEKILEQKSAELYQLNQELNAKNLILQQNFTTKEKELQDLAKNLVEGYVIANLDGFVLKMNDSAKDIFELESSGSFNLQSLVANDQEDHLSSGIKILLEDKALSNFELRIITPSEQAKTILINASAIKDAKGTVVALQALFRDVTEIRKLESDRELLLQKLKLQNQELEEYAHVISHDLKSPLRNLYTLNTWIKEKTQNANDPQVTEYFEMIFSTLERMDNMIVEILNFSKSDKDAMHFESVDLNVLLAEICQQYIGKSNIEIELTPDFPSVYGVKIKLFQVFQNLIDNAIKFNNKEKGQVKISHKKTDQAKTRITVWDNGKGISERQQAKVFKLFETTEKSHSSSGVGLAIVKKILDAHQSEIRLESSVDEYTQFSFELNISK